MQEETIKTKAARSPYAAAGQILLLNAVLVCIAAASTLQITDHGTFLPSLADLFFFAICAAIGVVNILLGLFFFLRKKDGAKARAAGCFLSLTLPFIIYFLLPVYTAFIPTGSKQVYCTSCFSSHMIGHQQECKAEKSEAGMKACLVAAAERKGRVNDEGCVGVAITPHHCVPVRRRGHNTGYEPIQTKALLPVKDPTVVEQTLAGVFCVNPDSLNGRNCTNCYTTRGGSGMEDCTAFADDIGRKHDDFSEFGTLPVIPGACPENRQGTCKTPDVFLANPVSPGTPATEGMQRRQLCLHHADGACGYCYIAEEDGKDLGANDCRAADPAADRADDAACAAVQDCTKGNILPPVYLPRQPQPKEQIFCLRYADSSCTGCMTEKDNVGMKDCLASAPGAVRVDVDTLCSAPRSQGGRAGACRGGDGTLFLPPMSGTDDYGRWKTRPDTSAIPDPDENGYLIKLPEPRNDRHVMCIHAQGGLCSSCTVMPGGIDMDCSFMAPNTESVKDGACPGEDGGCSAQPDGIDRPHDYVVYPRKNPPDVGVKAKYCMHHKDGWCATCEVTEDGFGKKECLAAMHGSTTADDGECPYPARPDCVEPPFSYGSTPRVYTVPCSANFECSRN